MCLSFLDPIGPMQNSALIGGRGCIFMYMVSKKVYLLNQKPCRNLNALGTNHLIFD